MIERLLGDERATLSATAKGGGLVDRNANLPVRAASAKPGVRTSEFWSAQIASAVLAIVPIANAIFGWNIDVSAELCYGAAASIQAAYVASRTVAKGMADGVAGRVQTEVTRDARSDSDQRRMLERLHMENANEDQRLDRVRAEAESKGAAK